MPDINWNEPLETDEPTPRAVRLDAPLDQTVFSRWVHIDGVPGRILYTTNGQQFNDSSGVPIRNVRPVRTADEALQRMEALVRRLATESIAWAIDEAREIVALLPEPVDPDIAETRCIANVHGYIPGHSIDKNNERIAEAVLAGIKRGRQLAAREA